MTILRIQINLLKVSLVETSSAELLSRPKCCCFIKPSFENIGKSSCQLVIDSHLNDIGLQR